MLAYLKEHIGSAIKRVTGRGSNLESILAILPEALLKLEVSNPSQWSNKDTLEQDEARLEQQGLKHQGYFVYRTNQDFVELSLWNYQNTVTVVLSDTIPESDDSGESSQYATEVLVRLDNGGTLCISNATSAQWLPRPQEHTMVATHSQDIFQLMKMLKTSTPEGCKIVPVSDSKSLFSESYEAVSGWLWQETQLNSGDFEQSCESLDISLSDDELDKLIQLGQTKLSSAYSNRILKRLERSSQISEDKWEGIRERLVVVHEKMRPEDISDILYQMVANISEDQEELIEEFTSSGELEDPIASFSGLMESLKPGAKRIAKMQRPVAGEVYLAD